MNRIAIVRRQRGLKQEDLAAALDVEQGSISKMENEKVALSLDNLRALAAAMHCTVGELVEEPPHSVAAMALAEMFDDLLPREQRQVQALVREMLSEKEAGPSGQTPAPAARRRAAKGS